MNEKEKALELRVAKLCRKFFDEVQAVFDSGEMTDAVYDGAVMQAAVSAQGYAEDAALAGGVR